MAPWTDEDLYGDEKVFRSVVHIEKSYAGRTSYNDGMTCLLILEGKRQTDDRDLEDWHCWVGLKGFKEADNNGTSVVGVVNEGTPEEKVDEKKRFGPNSKVRKLMQSYIDAGIDLTEKGVDSRDCTMYSGVSVVWEEHPERGEFGGEKRTWRQPLVRELLGEFDGPPQYIDVDLTQYEKDDDAF